MTLTFYLAYVHSKMLHGMNQVIQVDLHHLIHVIQDQWNLQHPLRQPDELLYLLAIVFTIPETTFATSCQNRPTLC